ncbi:MAG TPA: papain-like cysteine protease family protein [Bryobacteraceae bacterium]|nr:papain-like cysteine protease family protein [Bryobacteraceae bacterium]
MAIEIRVSRGTDGVTLSILNGTSGGAIGPEPAVVVGPIVIDQSGTDPATGPANGGGGPGTNPPPGPGGGPGINPPPGPGGGGPGINPPPGPGGGGPGTNPPPGPGGSAFGSGLVVIGPIVITGAGGGAAPNFIPSTFPLKHQEMAYWCWVAVTEAVKEYFSPSTKLTQCEVATAVLTATKQIGANTNCCTDSAACNVPATLQDALGVTHNLHCAIRGPLTWEDIKTQLGGTPRKPICVRIEWDDHAGGHFIAIYGYREFTSGIRQVLVADPLFPEGTAAYVLYEDILNFYDQFGYWSDTFLVTP